MKSCGKRFHDEVGKFRFLNELIKVVSPKYLGSRTSEKVKNKILELLYSWTVGLPEEAKIAEAYQMLKKQGIVKSDPKLPDDTTFPLPPPRPKNVIFEDEEKSKDQKRMEKISKRVNAIEEVNNNVKLLTEMVMSHSQGGAAAGSSEDLMKSTRALTCPSCCPQELYQRCERMRPTLFRLASDTEDNDEALAEILQANDNLTQVINLYKQLVRGEEVNGDATAASIPGSTSALLDLSGLDLPPAGTTYPAMPTRPGEQASPEQPSASVSLLDDELMSLGEEGPGLEEGGHSSKWCTIPGRTRSWRNTSTTYHRLEFCGPRGWVLGTFHNGGSGKVGSLCKATGPGGEAGSLQASIQALAARGSLGISLQQAPEPSRDQAHPGEEAKWSQLASGQQPPPRAELQKSRRLTAAEGMKSRDVRPDQRTPQGSKGNLREKTFTPFYRGKGWSTSAYARFTFPCGASPGRQLPELQLVSRDVRQDHQTRRKQLQCHRHGRSEVCAALPVPESHRQSPEPPASFWFPLRGKVWGRRIQKWQDSLQPVLGE
ncbi:hypothetical protein P7K49_002939 [Saguinus oedipus]|uniref:ADP-ribosylation factor-binding protein GGA1 n=1 Tax=Saguinus oedipus TaxID=9490 RepID=A0ABQ9WLE2_SAGOE|nr:hypothetical protein P7K49_002939 [Saguinus oedipus]